MKNISTLNSHIEIDLSFNILLSQDPKEISSASESIIWHKEDFWNILLNTWLSTMRDKETIYCPQLVRERKDFSIGLEFIDDLSIAKLNSEWRGKNESTDVLSFPALNENIIVPENN